MAVATATAEEAINSIVSLDCFIKASIQDLWSCETLEDLQNIINSARTKIAELRSTIQTLETLAFESDEIQVKEELGEAAKFYKDQLESTQVALRKAIVNGKQKIDALAKSHLLSKTAHPDVRQRSSARSNKENISRTAKDLTQNLLSISRSMHDSVKQSSDTLNTLASSSKTVSTTNEDLKTQHGHIKTSHNLLTKYGRREFTDKFLIFLALILFFSTVLYILKRRLYPG